MLKPKTLSASSAHVFEQCPARWTAEYFLRGRGVSTSAASLGTACHEALEVFVREADLYSFDRKAAEATLTLAYDDAYWRVFADESRHAEGWGLLSKWMNRTLPFDLDTTVISTEFKKSFDISVKHDGESFSVPFNYIMDRVDRHKDGTIEVVDYKTVAIPISPESLRNKIQARCYALAAQIEHPEAPRIWVTFDLLRHEAVGTVFKREDNIATWKYLKSVLTRILETDGNDAPETLNAECRWCVRKNVCKALTRHVDVKGSLAVTDPGQAALRRYELSSARAALDAAIAEMDEVVLAHCEQEEILEFETEQVAVRVTAAKRRDVDKKMAAKIIGPELAAEYGTIGVTIIDRLLKDSRIDLQQREQLKGLIGVTWGDPSVKVEPRSAMDRDE